MTDASNISAAKHAAKFLFTKKKPKRTPLRQRPLVPMAIIAIIPALAFSGCGKSQSETAENAPNATVTQSPSASAEAASDAPAPAPPQSTPAKTASLTPPLNLERRISTVKSTNKVSTGDMVLGDEGAALTIVEYASVTCPHCAAFHATIIPMIKEEFVETGKAVFIYRDFPTAPAQLSYAGSVLARCTADRSGIDGYFAVLGNLFKNQQQWAFGDTPKESLLKIMAQTGMTEDDFKDCLGRQDIVDAINISIKEASEDFDVDATPTIFVNGEKMRFVDVDQYRDGLNAAFEAASSPAPQTPK